ncbi:MAG: hypothetical protein OEZ19_10110 [Paracoccaceae bacterium]|nr:hypothetical protein [Paracoccaceae bacterium]
MMTLSDYEKKHYRMSATHGVDTLTVEKDSRSDWATIRKTIHDDSFGEIEIRSKEMAEQLHFMLGQMLEK